MRHQQIMKEVIMMKAQLNSLSETVKCQQLREELLLKILYDYGISEPGELVEVLQYLDEKGYFATKEYFETHEGEDD